ncbi:hypothetical protein M3484_19830 [Pseudomonas sp. GX19020]|uniref:hypothetical protein n=1 Tax=Pseudomonas sp. GX19020 TaxID=2942277 RepID=UPI002018CF90|nr:hypothetical protein [Pseudomonas sp. GX19020]MCL4068814.1 hypothetical protein [Pseudomonas sp. GX19020]
MVKLNPRQARRFGTLQHLARPEIEDLRHRFQWSFIRLPGSGARWRLPTASLLDLLRFRDGLKKSAMKTAAQDISGRLRCS